MLGAGAGHAALLESHAIPSLLTLISPAGSSQQSEAAIKALADLAAASSALLPAVINALTALTVSPDAAVSTELRLNSAAALSGRVLPACNGADDDAASQAAASAAVRLIEAEPQVTSVTYV